MAKENRRDRGVRRVMAWLLVAVLLPAVMLGVRPPVAHAHESPSGCFKTGIPLFLIRSPSSANLGDQVTFTALIDNNGTGLCDLSDVSITVTTPDGVPTVVAAGLNIPVGSPIVSYDVVYTITAANVANNLATASAAATGTLHDGADTSASSTINTTVSVPLGVGVTNICTIGADGVNPVRITVTGTSTNAPDGSAVNLTIGPDSGSTTTAGGAWTVTMPWTQADNDYNVTAQVTYPTGNSGSTSPLLPIRTIQIGGGENPSVTPRQPVIAGTTGAAPGTTVSVTIGAETNTTTVQGDNSWSLTWPTTLADGTYAVTAQIVGGECASDTQSLTISNAAPVAADDTYSMTAGTTLTTPASGVLGNDSDPNGDPITAVLVTDVASGTLTLNPDGSFTYTPPGGFSGDVTFTYQASDGTLQSNVATVTITVIVFVPPPPPPPPPAPVVIRYDPVAMDDSYTVDEGSKLIVQGPGVQANDSDLDDVFLSTSLLAGPGFGQLTLQSDGSFTYIPNPGSHGTDSFRYRLSDGSGGWDVADVTITVRQAAKPQTVEAAITGTVIDAATGQVVSGATVAVEADFDGDGKPDFASSVVTGPDGTYQIAVPRPNWTYTSFVTTPVHTENGAVTITTAHKTVVDESGTNKVYNAEKKVAGQVFVQVPGTAEPQRPDQALAAGQRIEAVLVTSGGEPVAQPVQVGADGQFAVSGVAPGQYRVVFNLVAPDGQMLAGAALTAAVTNDGELVVGTVLIDPAGQVTDAMTGQPVAGAKVTLYWADTALNRAKGRTPDTAVSLPALPGFQPAMNAVPQFTTSQGLYAWMVYPEGDYYIRAEKAGYRPYDSRTEGRNVPAAAGEDSFISRGVIHVGTTLVEYDFLMEPIHRRFILGYPDGTFRPERSITRAEIAAIFARIVQPTAVTMDLPPYGDVAETHWARHYIAVVRQHGLMQGDRDGNFRPDAPITRAELAAVISRYKQFVLSGSSPFTDTEGHWAEAAISAVYQAGIATGYPDGSFRPEAYTIRAEAATMINRTLERGPLSGRPVPTWPDVPFSYWASGQVEEASSSHSARRDGDGHEEWTSDTGEETW